MKNIFEQLKDSERALEKAVKDATATKRGIIALLGLFILTAVAGIYAGAQAHTERHYQEIWCKEQGGEIEVVMPDKTRCDCVTETHAVEMDFGPKWAEAIGQALFYGLQTGKKPGIALILESEKDYKYWIRLNTVLEHYDLPIETWKIEGERRQE